jgi:RNA polymerase sigma-70 factor (ECF subfamily)
VAGTFDGLTVGDAANRVSRVATQAEPCIGRDPTSRSTVAWYALTMDSFDDLITRAKAGEQAAQAELFARFREVATTSLRKQRPSLRRQHDEDDLLQEVWSSVLRELPNRAVVTESAFHAWLRTIIVKRFRDMLRRRVSGPSTLDPPMATAELDSPAEAAERGELAKRLHDAMATLPERDRQIIALRSEQDRTFTEIAETVGLSTASVRARYSRALRRLRDAMKKMGFESEVVPSPRPTTPPATDCLAVEIDVAGLADSEICERVAELVVGLDAVHRQVGGSGLTIRDSRARRAVRARVPS